MVSVVLLKRLCIGVNVLFAVFGGILIILGIIGGSVIDDMHKTKEETDDTTHTVVLFCVGGSFTIVVSLLGIYFACKRNKWSFILYVTLLSNEFCLILWIAIPMAVIHPQLQETVENQFHEMVPLYRQEHTIQKNLNKLQTVAECCGLFGYPDWEPSIPQSCHCPPDYEDKATNCVNVSQKDTRMHVWHNRQDSAQRIPGVWEYQVYKKPCGPIIFKYLNYGIKLMLGISFTAVIVMVLAVILSYILYKENKKEVREAALFNNALSKINH